MLFLLTSTKLLLLCMVLCWYNPNCCYHLCCSVNINQTIVVVYRICVMLALIVAQRWASKCKHVGPVLNPCCDRSYSSWKYDIKFVLYWGDCFNWEDTTTMCVMFPWICVLYYVYIYPIELFKRCVLFTWTKLKYCNIVFCFLVNLTKRGHISVG